MPEITGNTLYQNAWQSLKDLLKDNLVDPKNRFKAEWILSRIPQTSKNGFVGYPFITISPVNMVPSNRSLNRNTAEFTFSTIISVYTDDNAVQLDELSTQIYRILTATQATNYANKVFQPDVSGGSPASITLDGKPNIRVRPIGIVFKTRLTVS